MVRRATAAGVRLELKLEPGGWGVTGVWGFLVFPDSGFLLSLTLLPSVFLPFLLFRQRRCAARARPLLTQPLDDVVVSSSESWFVPVRRRRR